MMLHEITPVAAFKPVAVTEAEKLLAYPFPRPENSVLTDGEQVIPLPDTFKEFMTAADALLIERGLPGMAERVPVIAYGANSSPWKNQEKMSTYGPEQQELLQTTPMLTATVPGTVIAWHGRPGQKGAIFAELYSDLDTMNEAASTHLTFLDEKQLAAIHVTEGITYRVQWLDVLAGSDRKPLKAIAYVANDATIFTKDGRPALVQRPGDTAIPSALTAQQAVDLMLSHGGADDDPHSAQELIESFAKLDLDTRKKIQKGIGQRLAQTGRSRAFAFPGDAADTMARGDFNGLQAPHYAGLRLVEQVVAPLRPTAEQIEAKASELQEKSLQKGKDLSRLVALDQARRKLDIAAEVRRRAHDELAVRLDADKAGRVL